LVVTYNEKQGVENKLAGGPKVVDAGLVSVDRRTGSGRLSTTWSVPSTTLDHFSTSFPPRFH